MNKLIYPNLFCFVYDLKEGLGFSQAEVINAQANFIQKIPHLFEIIENDRSFETEYHELLQSKIDKFIDKEDGYTGYYYPVRLNDTYGLLVACSPSESNQAYDAYEVIYKLKAKIDKRLAHQPGTLGTTWMVLSHIPRKCYDRKSEIAQDCYKALMKNSNQELLANWELDLVGHGEFLGGTLFELSQYQVCHNSGVNKREISDDYVSLDSTQGSYHILIQLYPNHSVAKVAAALNFDWMRLFCYRHKILFAYTQSRFIKQELNEGYREIHAIIKLFNKERHAILSLRKLKRKLLQAQYTLYYYSADLNKFSDQIRTMEVNLLNYERRVKVIHEKAKKAVHKKILLDYDYLSSWGFNLEHLNLVLTQEIIIQLISPYNLNFLYDFTNEFNNKYILQIQKDYESLSPGLILLQNLIDSIDGITDLDQAQRDRNFQIAVGIVGIGLAIGASLASISGHFPNVNINNETDISENFIVTILLNLGVSKAWIPAAISIFISFGLSIFSIMAIFMMWIFLNALRHVLFTCFQVAKRFW